MFFKIKEGKSSTTKVSRSAPQKITEITDKQQWKSILRKISSHDFYHTYDYHVISANENEQPILLVYQDGQNLIALPLILRNIENTNYSDFTSVYGYCGPITNIKDTSFNFLNFQLCLKDYLKQKGVVSLFSRLHPFLNQNPIIEGLGNVEELGKVINIDVSKTIEESRAVYSKSNKNQINKLRRKCEVVLAKTEEEILEFVDIYHENMRRLNAKEHYFFDKEYFLNFLKVEDFQTDIILIRDIETKKFIAGSMFVKTGKIVQFHLSGTRTEFLKLHPSKLFLDEMRLRATEEGYTFFNLGGGLAGEEDSLFDFKASFSKDFRLFKVWKCVVDEEAYNQLSSGKEESNFFPKYREFIK
ncbi:GNAT family N-acetyltransferase [Winogradskyella tangerina]|uniref:GNAT family N-acetyltransferase n=1 Tax=Winogradskyella tangerina TaxID=2023240 RepID=UPI000DBE0027|nr:GNAT family N-acetyltransferase [Winogradskyella tangerina]